MVVSKSPSVSVLMENPTGIDEAIALMIGGFLITVILVAFTYYEIDNKIYQGVSRGIKNAFRFLARRKG